MVARGMSSQSPDSIVNLRLSIVTGLIESIQSEREYMIKYINNILASSHSFNYQSYLHQYVCTIIGNKVIMKICVVLWISAAISHAARRKTANAIHRSFSRATEANITCLTMD